MDNRRQEHGPGKGFVFVGADVAAIYLSASRSFISIDIIILVRVYLMVLQGWVACRQRQGDEQDTEKRAHDFLLCASAYR